MSKTLPPLPDLGPEWTAYWTKVVHEKMQAYAIAAIAAQGVPDVDALAQFIREIDGKNDMGAGALAERVCAWLASAPPAPQAAVVQQEPYAWHYTNKTGVSVWHLKPSMRLDAAIAAANEYPSAHRVVKVYTHPAPLAKQPLMDEQRIAVLEQQLSEARKDAERWAHACKGNNKQINVCSWDGDAYEFVGYAMKKEAIDAIADEEIAAMQKGKT